MPQAHGAEGTDGVFHFTERSAAAVMSAYQKHGADLIVDLAHESLHEAKRADSHDARGWFKLEVRGGELWAVDVKWTPDGARRLAEKTQRYISPAFGVDAKTNEITDLVNVGLVAMPATEHAPALVAARVRTGTRMTDEQKATCIAALALCLRASMSRVRLGVKP